MYMNKFFLFLLLFPLYLNAQYKIIVASVENKESLNIVIKDVKNILEENKSSYKVDFIKTENNYNRIIVPMIPNINEAKKVRKIISTKYKDCYIREYEKNSTKTITKPKLVATDVFSKLDFQKYNKAVSSFQTRDYKTSYKIFNELSIIYVSNDKLNYYLGRSAFELKKFSEAYLAFNKIDIKNELHLRIRLEKARTLYFLKSHDLAVVELNRILQYPISIKVRKNIEKFIKKINKEKNNVNFS